MRGGISLAEGEIEIKTVGTRREDPKTGEIIVGTRLDGVRIHGEVSRGAVDRMVSELRDMSGRMCREEFFNLFTMLWYGTVTKRLEGEGIDVPMEMYWQRLKGLPVSPLRVALSASYQFFPTFKEIEDAALKETNRRNYAALYLSKKLDEARAPPEPERKPITEEERAKRAEFTAKVMAEIGGKPLDRG